MSAPRPRDAARDQERDREAEHGLQRDRADDEDQRRQRARLHDRRREDVDVVVEPDEARGHVAGHRVVGERQPDQPDQRPDREEQQQRERRRDEQAGEPAVGQEAEAPRRGRRLELLGAARRRGRCLERVGHVVVEREGQEAGRRPEPGLPWSSLLAAALVENGLLVGGQLVERRVGLLVPEIAALTWVEWTFRSFAYSGRFQKSFRRGTDSVNTLLYGCASRNSGDWRTSLRAGTPPSCAHFFWASGVWNHLMKFSASACFSSGMYLRDVQAHAAERHLVRVLLGQRREGQLLEDLLLGLAELGARRIEQAAHGGDPLEADADLALADRGVDLVDEPVARALGRERDHLVDEDVHRLLAGGVVDDAVDLAVVLRPTARRRRARS